MILGAACMLFAVLAYTQTGSLPAQAALFPKLVIFGMGVSGFLLIVDTLTRHRRRRLAEVISINLQTAIYQILIPGAMMLVTYGLLQLIGFYAAGFLLIQMVFFYQPFRTGGVRPTLSYVAKGVVFAAVTMTVMYIAFTLLLKLPVPRGSFFS
ncbi:tripartite tricarboxylate transporter TctB family protein [Alkalispirochaeta americana]|nr:tripartite tricarboxylate transporter TctB family protein [Alkalispirochaeta americana]